MSNEQRTPAKVRIVRLICDCGNEMKYTGKSFPVMPPKYEYQCPNCRKKEISEKNYPFMEYEEIKA